MKFRYLAILLLITLLSASTNLTVSAPVMAQSSQMKDDMEQLAVDLHVGVDRSTLTAQQKAQLRDDFRELKEAHQNHEMFKGLRAARSIRAALDSGAFKPEDQQRIKQDIQAIKEAREQGSGFHM
jgi:Spy/CpxP family protein refolding chaperone